MATSESGRKKGLVFFSNPRMAGDIRLLSATITAEQNRIPAEEAEAVLSDDPAYSSPFVSMPF
jgi:hypothetical protein